MTLTDYTTDSTMTNIVGSCSNSDTPDMWHPEIPRGGLGAKTSQELLSSMKAAIKICNSCPVQRECLNEGMKDENLPWGIWGGKLAGERIIASGKSYNKGSDEGLAMRSYRILGPLLRG